MSSVPPRYRKPAELARLGTRHAVVEASAGTGKTYVLEHLVVDLILTRDVGIERILVVTFTEKATAELVSRVRHKLEELRALAADHPNAAGAADADCWIIDERARRRLGEALHAFDRASIFTIHAFCQRLLGEHAFLSRRLFDEETVDEEEAFDTAFAATLRGDVASDPALGRYLQLWLGEGDGALGKLRRAVSKAVRGLACVYPGRPGALRPSGIDEAAALAAAQAFVRTAGEGEREDLRAALRERKVPHQTVRAAGERLEELAVIAAEARTVADVPALLAAIDRVDRARDGVFDYLHEKLHGHAGDARVRPVTEGIARLEAAAPPLLAALAAFILPRVSARMEAEKREAGLYDFQDMLTLVARSLDGEGERQRTLLATLRGRYRHALIDEFQDTDEVQWAIFRRIFFESPDGHVLTVIGDPKQAIYGFRGADVHTYVRARSEILAAGGERIDLTVNYRSSAPLIEGVNAILDQAAPFFRPGGRILYDRPVTCGRPQLRLEPGDAPGAGAPALVVLDLETAEKNLLTWQVKQALLARMVDEVGALLVPGGRGLSLRSDEGREPIRAGDIFVLTRTTRESREVGEALRAARIPFAYFKQERLFGTIEAREVLDLLRAIADPDDVTARARALITPFFGLGLADLAACDDLDPSDALLRLLYDWRALAESGDFEALFARIIDDSGIVCREIFFRDSERSLTNILHLLEILQEEAARTRATVRELAQTLGAFINGTRRPPGEARDIQRLETDAAAVQIMTIHHSKGLEAAVVFVYGGFWHGSNNDVRVLHDEEGRRVVRIGRQPRAEASAYEVEDEDEERRVLYVALTRARARLYLPRYPAAFRQLRGCYRMINERLGTLLGAFTAPETKRLFHPVPVPCPAPGPRAAPLLEPAVLAGWRPPDELLAPDPSPDRRSAAAAARAGFVVTSYSAVKRRHGGVAPAVLAAEALDDPAVDEPLAGEEAVSLPAGELPRGRLSGRFLHGVLEELPLETLADAPALAVWSARPAVAAVFERMRRRHDRRADHLPHARRLVHTALTAAVRLGETSIPGLGTVTPALREMEFLFPIPERAHPLLEVHRSSDDAGTVVAGGGAAEGSAATDALPFRIERGLVKGYVDLLFEHQGRGYVCDWKSDWLPSYGEADLAIHSRHHYAVQAQIYTVAALRLLGVGGEREYERRFGGVVYGYLRGMNGGDDRAGLYFHRPAWREILAWQAEMLGERYWRLG